VTDTEFNSSKISFHSFMKITVNYSGKTVYWMQEFSRITFL